MGLIKYLHSELIWKWCKLWIKVRACNMNLFYLLIILSWSRFNYNFSAVYSCIFDLMGSIIMHYRLLWNIKVYPSLMFWITIIMDLNFRSSKTKCWWKLLHFVVNKIKRHSFNANTRSPLNSTSFLPMEPFHSSEVIWYNPRALAWALNLRTSMRAVKITLF